MPKVRLLAAMNVAGGFREYGEECDVPSDVAAMLTNAGRAVILRGEEPDPARTVQRRRERTDRARGEQR